MGKDLKGKELGSGISQRKDGLYVARYTNKIGKRVQKVLPKLQECRKWLSDCEYNDSNGTIESCEDMTVNAWFNTWITLSKSILSNNTIRNYTYRYEKNVKPAIGNNHLKEVTTLKCQLILNQMAEEDYKTSTIRLTKSVLCDMFDYAVDNGLISRNPCNKKLKWEIGAESRKIFPMSVDQQMVFCNSLDDMYYANAFYFILNTGVRIGELIGLQWGDIDFKNKTMSINRQTRYIVKEHIWETGKPKSKAGMRTIPLTDKAIEILLNQKDRNKKIGIVSFEWKDNVFLGKNGFPIKNGTYNSAMAKACKRAGIEKFTVHSLRHTFATRCIEQGMTPKTLQSILGHANLSTTMDLYVHSTEDRKKMELDMVSSALKVV